MESKGLTLDEKYQLIMECRRSGLTDSLWCRQQGLSVNTFYCWVKRLRKLGYAVPAAHGKNTSPAPSQDVVKVEVIPDRYEMPAPYQPDQTYIPAIRIDIAGAHLEISNDAEPALLAGILKTLGGLA